ncbi:MAG TPA: hypothetical protein VFL84_13945, partial [Gammaproteobacteria bacterium]|nr:hypothetical protein [Gammaproteobacteria bacterium]
MFPIGRRCAPPERRLPARRLARRAARIALPVLASLSLGVAALAGAQQNLGFETLDGGALSAWSVAGGSAEIASGVDAAEGEQSLEIQRAEPGVTRVTQRIPAARLRVGGDAPRLRLTGLTRQHDSRISAALWLRIDGKRGPLFLDSGGYAREPGESPAASPQSAGGGKEWRRLEVELPFPRDVDEVAFGVIVRGQGTAWFDALELRVVAVDSERAASPAATRYLGEALALMREHSLRRAEIDWPALRAQALEHARGAVTDADAHLAVRFALRELGDRHSYLQSAAATRALAATAVANARTGSPLTPPRARPLGANLAYVSVPGFAGGT